MALDGFGWRLLPVNHVSMVDAPIRGATKELTHAAEDAPDSPRDGARRGRGQHGATGGPEKPRGTAGRTLQPRGVGGGPPFLIAHADGTQNYICLPTATGVAWTFLGPQATLFDRDLDQVMTHYLSPNPQEAGIARATWRHSRDTSTVWAAAVETSSDAAFVAPGAIPWLKLQVLGATAPDPTTAADSRPRRSSNV